MYGNYTVRGTIAWGGMEREERPSEGFSSVFFFFFFKESGVINE